MVFAISVVAFAGQYLNSAYCGFTKEIKAYTAGDDNFYYFGQRYCPATWGFKTLSVDGISDLEGDKDIVVISQKESAELEIALNNKFLSFTRFTAGDEFNKFLIYETECQKCKN